MARRCGRLTGAVLRVMSRPCSSFCRYSCWGCCTVGVLCSVGTPCLALCHSSLQPSPLERIHVAVGTLARQLELWAIIPRLFDDQLPMKQIGGCECRLEADVVLMVRTTGGRNVWWTRAKYGLQRPQTVWPRRPGLSLCNRSSLKGLGAQPQQDQGEVARTGMDV
jgi:hypothetical protein